MAAAAYPDAGTEFGECADPCDHHDCASTRRDKAMICRYCNEPIGTRSFFSKSNRTELVHATCEYEAIEAET